MKKTHLVTIIVFLIVLSIFTGGFIYYKHYLEEGKTYTYNGAEATFEFEIVKKPGIDLLFHRVYVYLTRDGKEIKYYINMRNSPMSVENIPFEDVRDKILYSNGKNTTYYITQDPDLPIQSNKISTLAVMNINRVTAGSVVKEEGFETSIIIYGIPTKSAVTRLTPDYEGTSIPIKDCKDATREEPVFKLLIGDENRIYKDGDWCVVLEAKSYEDLLKVADKFVYNLIGVF